MLSLGLVVPAALFGPASPAAAYPSSTVVISGHGYGHGIGMGQWGSLGYAIGQDNGEGNYTYQQILGHYYGNDGNGGRARRRCRPSGPRSTAATFGSP